MDEGDADLEMDDNEIIEVNLGKRRALAAWVRVSVPWSR